jgi:hypothetical protein
MSFQKFKLKFISGILLIGFLLVACNEFGNDSPSEGKTLRIDLANIQSQMGINNIDKNQLNSVSAPGDTDATIAVKGLVVGALKVNERSTAYTLKEALTDDVLDDMKADVINSAEFLIPLTLPITENYIEITLPPSTAGNWQVIAVGVDFEINTLGEIGEEAHSDSIVYAGFSSSMYTTDGYDGSTISFNMVRNCWSKKTSKGCAVYTGNINEDPIVTAAVEILGVQYNNLGTDFVSLSCNSFPIIVADSGDVSAAIHKLQECRTDIIDAGASLSVLTTRTTHRKNTIYESAACQSSSDTTSDLESKCQVQVIDVYLTVK